MQNLHDYNTEKLCQKAKEIRLDILSLIHHAKMGHTGGSLSEVEILTALYFKFLKYDISDTKNIERDRFILSKGHCSPGLYTTLYHAGFLTKETLYTFDQTGTKLQAHPDMNKCPVDYSTGSLGQGVSVGIGMTLGREKQNLDFNTWVLIGDGESQEGQIWEAALYAGAKKLKKLCIILDYNKVQLSSTTDNAVSLEPVLEKWKAFGFEVLETNGHDMTALVATMAEAEELMKTSCVFIKANTVKGKGVSFMEGKYQWHGKAPNDKEYAEALQEVKNA